MDEAGQQTSKLSLVAGIVSSYLRQNSIGVDQISGVFANVTKALGDAEQILAGGIIGGNGATAETAPAETYEPFVSVRTSVKQDYIICLVCGAKVKTLKRHLMSAHGLDPRAYRERYSLKRDYPMTAPAYSEKRSKMARDLGLGRKAGEKPARRSRKKVAAAAMASH
jgi:predicted transcriptional regulator